MTSIGIRELRDALSKHIAQVREGATITVTDHGTPVARIVPVGTPSALEQLIAEGVVQLPAHRKRPAPDPVVADVSLSETVLADRR
ncbi:type II toxin-antitoxin system Phd/YefM family antitoxin [Modestobacter excelsi]|uniref:type II toxin-antitoxin system Phd/YefM family antitoxin n=1 Tax=Modestobacter excelsi TaxID=2213161 RepID=UPI00110CDBEF|nr:type II toxin-antitoxin system prevent-host-death family antitoxin [Modestobacter excelsi]